MGTYENLVPLNEKTVIRKVPPPIGALEDKECIRQEYAKYIGVPADEVQCDGMVFSHPSTTIVKYLPKMPRQVIGKFTVTRHRYTFTWIDGKGEPRKHTQPLKNIRADKGTGGTVHMCDKGFITPFATYQEVID